jgi:hypothetical protein
VSGLARELEFAFSRLEALVGPISDADLDRPAGGGWSVGAVLGHLTAWQDAAAYRLHRFDATGHEQDVISGDMDGFNSQVAREVSGRTAEQLKHSLSRSFTRLRDAYEDIAHTTDNLDWANEMVLGNTIHHYEEHSADLALTS